MNNIVQNKKVKISIPIAVVFLLVSVFMVVSSTSSMVVHAYSEQVNLLDLKFKGVWDYSKYGKDNKMEYIEYSGGFGAGERETEATIYVIYRRTNVQAKYCKLYAVEADHTKGLATALTIYNRLLTEEEYTYSVEADFTIAGGCKYAKVAFNIGGGNTWGNSNESSREIGDTIGISETTANKHIKAEASGYMYTYYILTLKVKRDLVTENSDKDVVGYKNYSVSINYDLSGDYISYEDLNFNILVTPR
ncbi:MAG: hypothetical protein LBE09_04940 [Christensenellaceae bacterium]|jgi:hypothetical protein|nr:hypothetical protein [Christensenellaceae bacterium]